MGALSSRPVLGCLAALALIPSRALALETEELTQADSAGMMTSGVARAPSASSGAANPATSAWRGTQLLVGGAATATADLWALNRRPWLNPSDRSLTPNVAFVSGYGPLGVTASAGRGTVLQRAEGLVDGPPQLVRMETFWCRVGAGMRMESLSLGVALLGVTMRGIVSEPYISMGQPHVHVLRGTGAGTGVLGGAALDMGPWLRLGAAFRLPTTVPTLLWNNRDEAGTPVGSSSVDLPARVTLGWALLPFTRHVRLEAEANVTHWSRTQPHPLYRDGNQDMAAAAMRAEDDLAVRAGAEVDLPGPGRPRLRCGALVRSDGLSSEWGLANGMSVTLWGLELHAAVQGSREANRVYWDASYEPTLWGRIRRYGGWLQWVGTVGVGIAL